MMMIVIVIMMILMPSPALARRSAAYTACVELHKVKMIIMIKIMILMMIIIHKIGELDDNMMPVGKESFLTKDMITITKVIMIVIK